MKSVLISLFIVFLTIPMLAQNSKRVLLKGQVLYKNSLVQNENVINRNTQRATITNKKGEFEILVKEGDELVFTAVNYQIKTVVITEKILRNNRLNVEVFEKVNKLDEVVLTPEEKEAQLKLTNEAFKQFSYEQDASTEVVNTTLSDAELGLKNGVNFVNIFKAIFKKRKQEGNKKEIKLSEVLRQVYDDDFFTKNLDIPQDKIYDFLFFCDDKIPTQDLLKKDKEFELIDFLITQSKAYLESAKAE